jgi:hypothetical protein
MSTTDNGSHLDIYAGIELVLGKLHKAIDKQNRVQALASKVSQPVFYTYVDNIIMPANGFGVVRLTGPDQGHVWYIRQVIVGGITPTTVAAGRADIFSSAADARSRTALNQFSMVDWRDTAAALPLVGAYSRGEISLRFNEELFVAFSGATPAQQYVAVCHVEDFEEGAIKQEWGL